MGQLARSIGLRDMFAAGPRAVSRYTGTLFAVFVAQSLVALAAMVAIALVLAQAFAHVPLFDDAVDGDLVALVECLRGARASMLAVVGIAFGGVLAWQLATWFLTGGVLGVLAQRPEGRRDTARCFGATGASTYLGFARLALCAVPSWLIVVFVWVQCVQTVAPRLEMALTTWDSVSSLLVAVVPAAVLWHVATTVVDYARIRAVVLRDDNHPARRGARLRARVQLRAAPPGHARPRPRRLARMARADLRLGVARAGPSDVRRRGRDHAVRAAPGRRARADGGPVRHPRRSGRTRPRPAGAGAPVDVKLEPTG